MRTVLALSLLVLAFACGSGAKTGDGHVGVVVASTRCVAGADGGLFATANVAGFDPTMGAPIIVTTCGRYAAIESDAGPCSPLPVTDCEESLYSGIEPDSSVIVWPCPEAEESSLAGPESIPDCIPMTVLFTVNE